MAPRMPRKGSDSTPKFNGSKRADLDDFMEEMDLLQEECELSDPEVIRYAKYYVSREVKELWMTTAEWRTGSSWAAVL